MDYDLAIVGGGIAGSSLAIALAGRGARVLIVEREAQFRDRVRGEGMLPWGAAEARELDIHQSLIEGCAHRARWWKTPEESRDLIETTPSRLGCLNFYHPEMQQQLLAHAVTAGAELRRPAEVTGVIPGERPTVILRSDGFEQRVTARLVVAADGRNSRVRAEVGFPVRRDADCLTIAGILYRDLALPDDAIQFVLNPEVQRLSVIFPVGNRRFRAYVVFRHRTRAPLSGGKDQQSFVDLSVATGASADWFDGALAIGPLASFDGADRWVHRPYRDGIVLIGDAAAASDPSFGCGLSLTLRDARVLRDCLAAYSDWAVAAAAYADQHDGYYCRLHRIHDWFRELWFGVGEEAQALRGRALPRIAEDPTRIPDFIALGPEAPNDEAARRRLFSED
jgi:2-polyprenyl-6-methoxyphenol hydroxylase-like FAD-dependent oxidoreductase